MFKKIDPKEMNNMFQNVINNVKTDQFILIVAGELGHFCGRKNKTIDVLFNAAERRNNIIVLSGPNFLSDLSSDLEGKIVNDNDPKSCNLLMKYLEDKNPTNVLLYNAKNYNDTPVFHFIITPNDILIEFPHKPSNDEENQTGGMLIMNDSVWYNKLLLYGSSLMNKFERITNKPNDKNNISNVIIKKAKTINEFIKIENNTDYLEAQKNKYYLSVEKNSIVVKMYDYGNIGNIL